MSVILVLDAQQRSALAATRSLGSHGYTVFTADTKQETLAGASRHSAESLVYPDPYTQPIAFIEWMASILTKTNIALVLPMTEVTTDLLLRHQKHWPNVALPFAGIDTIDLLANKIKLHKLAQTLDIAIPQTRYYEHAEQLLEETNGLTYPLILKPYRSRIWLGDRWLNTAVTIARSAQDLYVAMNSETFAEHPFMMQEFIEGEGQGIFALYDHGKPVVFFAHRRIRERPPWGGVSVLSESVLPNKDLLNIAERLLTNVQWHGVAMVEFKVTADGTPYLMEINTRFWGSLQLAIDAGIDFPSLLVDMSFGKSINEPVLKEGVRLRWLLGDLDHFYLTWRSPHFSLRQKLKSSLNLLKPDTHGRTRHEINRIDDFKPAIYELRRYLGV